MVVSHRPAVFFSLTCYMSPLLLVSSSIIPREGRKFSAGFCGFSRTPPLFSYVCYDFHHSHLLPVARLGLGSRPVFAT